MMVSVVYASVLDQKEIVVEINKTHTVRDAIHHSGICDVFPEIDLNTVRVGVFSQFVALDDTLHQGDRIEIYRPLTIDPKEARRRRAG